MRWFKRSKKRTEKEASLAPSEGSRKRWLRWPKFVLALDLGHPTHRLKLFLSSVVMLIVAIVFFVGGYESFHYVESAEFCGTLCHPMKSVFTRYEKSAHANVPCAECHVGPGLSHLIKAKVDGTRQVIALFLDSYQRPIPSPVHNLRPARETCEHCHTPTAFKDNIVKPIVHYDDDKDNTLVQSSLILKMGGWYESAGMSESIHWHVANEVYYIPADEKRQVISWVGVRQADGSLKEYFARDMLNISWDSFVEEARASGEMRLMDCIDCHNRTGHFIPSPEMVVDEAIHDDRISADLPYIRARAVELLLNDYASEVEAYAAIDELAKSYADELANSDPANSPQAQTALGVALGPQANPDAASDYRSKVEAAIGELKQLYSETNFPDMNLNWKSNPNNARHTPFPGCFRCHDDRHVTMDESGNEMETITIKCNTCHTVPIVGRGDRMQVESPVIVGAVPATHSDFRWTIEHRSVSGAAEQECYECHGRGFCDNGACHNLSHPPDMLVAHAEEYRKIGAEICYNCHQDILCSRCHPGGIVASP